MPAIEERRWTFEEFAAFADQQEDRSIRYEFADGELLVTPAPSQYHQRMILALYDLIAPYARKHGLGEVRLGPSRVHLAARTQFEPDLHVVPSVDGRRPRADVPVTRAILVVEVLSPGSGRHDRLTKRGYYQRAEVSEYWIVDQDAQLVERWRPTDDRPDVSAGALAWPPAGMAEPLFLALAVLVRSGLDD
jgi:Uma2 family endonuclease